MSWNQSTALTSSVCTGKSASSRRLHRWRKKDPRRWNFSDSVWYYREERCHVNIGHVKKAGCPTHVLELARHGLMFIMWWIEGTLGSVMVAELWTPNGCSRAVFQEGGWLQHSCLISCSLWKVWGHGVLDVPGRTPFHPVCKAQGIFESSSWLDKEIPYDYLF